MHPKTIALAAFLLLPSCVNDETTSKARSQTSQSFKAGQSCDSIKTNSYDLDTANSWAQIKQQRDQQLESYLCQTKDAYQSFTHTPVGYSGMPVVIFRLLPDVLPEVWGRAHVEERTGFFFKEGEEFPHGFTYGKDANSPSQVVNLTCAGCHTGRVLDATGQEKILVGAPSTTMDTLGFRRKMFDSVQHQNFTAANFLGALASKKPGWLYGKDEMLEQEAIDIKVFEANAEKMIAGLKTGYINAEKGVHSMLGAYSYRKDPEILNGYQAGALEAFGFASMLQMPSNFVELDQESQLEAMKEVLPPQPAVVDIMSVWRQGDRTAAQWDGNIKARLIRNLGAEVGVIRDPALTNYQNAVVTTDFVEHLPAPAYPFEVDLQKAKRGKEIYQYACAECHETNRFMPVDAIGTDPGRAIGLTDQARIGLTANLKAACIDEQNPACQVPDEEILVPRQENPGYTSQLLDGIWARAPYLHNGSVPTMHHLLIPSSRPKSFQRGNIAYDQINMGFEWREGGLNSYETSRPGFSSEGHADLDTFFGGIDFSQEPEKLADLIEYLKTL